MKKCDFCGAIVKDFMERKKLMKRIYLCRYCDIDSDWGENYIINHIAAMFNVLEKELLRERKFNE